MHADSILQRRTVPASVAGFVGVLVLCGGLGFVVHQAVRQGEALRRANAMLHEATWRCQALRDRDSRARCLKRYRTEMPADSAQLQAIVSEAEHRSPHPDK